MIKNRIQEFPFVAFLLPLFFLLHGFARYFGFIPFGSFVSLTVLYLLCAGLLFLAFLWLYRNVKKAGVAVAVSFFLYCFFGAFLQSMHRLFGNAFISRYSFLLPFLVVCYAGLLVLLKRKRISAKLVVYLNLLFLLLIVYDAGAILLKSQKGKKEPQQMTNCSSCIKPDVYLLVVDGYAGKEQLENVFQFGNDAFLDSLRRLNFRVMENSRANYVRTEFSVSSMLNMDYHQRNDYGVTEESLFYCYRQIAQNKVVDAFRRQGYAFVNNSIFDIGNEESAVRNTFLVNGADLISNETLGTRLMKDVYVPFLFRYLQNTSFYRNYLFQVRRSDEAIEKRLFSLIGEEAAQPRFVYSHFLLTHFPYYFKESGELNKLEDIRLDNYENKALYLTNLKAANKQLLSLLNTILRKSARPPVILLVSDHGFRYSNKPETAFSNLAAVYLPQNVPNNFYDTISNVNLFRVLFNGLYNQHLPLLPDRNGQAPQVVREEEHPAVLK